MKRKSLLNSNMFSENASQIRLNHYERYLGKLDQPILHPIERTYPHVDIIQIAPTLQKPYWTLITNGMSDAKQPVPPDDSGASGRNEILMYVAEPQDWMINLLGEIALRPFVDNIYTHWGHICDFGSRMVTEKTNFTHVLHLHPFCEDKSFYTSLKIDGENVDFLWVVPITREEVMQCLEDNCICGVTDNFVQDGHPRYFSTV